ncbi:MAG: type I secretion C-terminal target domain-containing protein, partial [Shewanella sp.]
SVTDAYGKTTPVTLALNFSHNETSNSGADPRDIVTVGQTNVTFNYQGQVYTLQVIGFKDANGKIVSSIYTNENAATSYQLVVKMVAGNGYTLPSTDGNVLVNDAAGADAMKTVIGADSGDKTSNGATGKLDTIISGLYGNLIIKADGSYIYQVTANASAIISGAKDIFTYTMQDGDGDKSSALLTINVHAVTSANVKAISAHVDDVDQAIMPGNIEGNRLPTNNDDQLPHPNADKINDTLIGGLGNDVLRGDSGADTFVWRYADADKGTDHIMDFNVSEDKLDLSDLLQGETATTLDEYLSFRLDSNGSTVIEIDANKDGVIDQHIVLDGVNLLDKYGATNADIINGLLGTNGSGPLIIDTQPIVAAPDLKHEPLKTTEPF